MSVPEPANDTMPELWDLLYEGTGRRISRDTSEALAMAVLIWIAERNEKRLAD